MTATEIITFNELTDRIESLAADNKFKIMGELLLTAINDWPTMNLIEPKDFLVELKNETNKSLTFDNLEKYSRELSINISGNAWRKESITSLLEMFYVDGNKTFDKSATLEDIVYRLTNYLKACCCK